MVTPLLVYQQALTKGFKEDAAQYLAVQNLERCFQTIHSADSSTPPPKGIYLWGPVGRGKTWLMDSFYHSLKVPAKRLHFHHFMRWLHKRLFQLTGQEDPLALIAQELASEVSVLCFDELYISDIGDVMLLSRLIQILFAEGLVLVVTSNQPPQQLYDKGFNREQLLPAISAIEQNMHILSVDGGTDHRLHPGASQQRYWVNAPQALAEVFAELTDKEPVKQIVSEPLPLGGRHLKLALRSQRVLWCNYQDLCEQAFAPVDFIELCDSFTHILLGQVPKLTGAGKQKDIARGTEDAAKLVEAGDRELPQLTHQDDGVRRFIALVDECYDRGVPLYLEAAVALNELYPEGALAFPFRRALSRLQEMQLERFAQKI
ncbi:cell division protein ZapE [Marinospirillum insulare]|uniref:Cell division protein ZapE n=1 Tax=Marinospirillum insulare TaxID=217169 RepID=A0ABQ5ZZR9_9GAMM|nr:cell division protein ZapE [Marinospirillum insulare]GLR63832.1 cell division protein ZapE [Marinospirillum insulare]